MGGWVQEGFTGGGPPWRKDGTWPVLEVGGPGRDEGWVICVWRMIGSRSGVRDMGAGRTPTDYSLRCWVPTATIVLITLQT